MLSHDCNFSSGSSLMIVVSDQGGLLPGRSFIRLVSHQGSLVIVVSHQGVFCMIAVSDLGVFS